VRAIAGARDFIDKVSHNCPRFWRPTVLSIGA
jgi:hypothetical protein